ncbi:MAG: hypothetical protein ABIY56_01735 [Dokdonella sp.]
MNYMKPVALALVAAFGMAIFSAPAAQAAELDCKLTFNLKGWSAIYKHSSGSGVVSCNNGQTMRIKITANGGGLTAGKTRIDNGTGKFSDVHTINDVLGAYVQGEATAAAGKSSTAQVLTKGTVSLALAGTGEGIALGVSVGRFEISKAK